MMADKIGKERRRRNMAAIRSENTRPEMIVRRLVYGLGYRYRLHRKDLPGKPDLVFASRRKVIFVHGCFWHQHEDEKCLDGRRPKSNTDYWNAKLDRNVRRDRENRKLLKEAGWQVMIVWECETEDTKSLTRRLDDFLSQWTVRK